MDVERLSEVVTPSRHYLAVENPRRVMDAAGAFLEFDGFMDFKGTHYPGTRAVKMTEILGYAYALTEIPLDA